MKIVLDESTPQKLRLLIDSRHEVVTTWFQGWSGMKNGELLAATEDAGFDLFITADQELSYQQNLASRKMAVLVLSTNNWSVVKDKIAEITAAIDAATPEALPLWISGTDAGSIVIRPTVVSNRQTRLETQTERSIDCYTACEYTLELVRPVNPSRRIE